ncbi:MAG: ATP-binding protein [Betaproteobacteria bacterium]
MHRRLFLLLLLFYQACTWAEGFTVARSYVHDEENALTVNAMGHIAWTPYGGDLRLGYTPGTTWVRVDITPSESASGLPAAAVHTPLVMRVGPYSLDHLNLYQRIDGQWTVSTAGDRNRRAPGTCLDDMHCFVLHATGEAPETVYLKVQTEGIRLIEMNIAPQDLLATEVATRISRISTAITLANGLLALGIFFFFLHRTVLLQAYCWFQASVVLSMYASAGRAAQFLTDMAPQTLDDMANFIQLFRVATTVLLGWAVLAKYGPAKGYQRAVAGLLLVSGVCCALVAGGHTRAALVLNLVLFSANPVVQLFGVYTAKIDLHRLKPTLFIGYGAYALVLAVALLSVFGFVNLHSADGVLQRFEDWRLNGVWIGMFVLWVVVSEQAGRKLQELREVQALRLESVRAKAQSDILQERTMLIDMLTHELKTPLGTIKFALASLQRDTGAHPHAQQRIRNIDSSVNRMNQMIERVASSIKVERDDIALAVEAVALLPLVTEITEELAHGGRFAVDVDPSLVVHTHRDTLAMVLENLVGNALKYASHDLVFITAVGRVLEVRNQVNEENRPDASRLFERYYRHPAVSGQPGLGLGLSLVRAACAQLGAAVQYRQNGNWAIFELTMPHRP